MGTWHVITAIIIALIAMILLVIISAIVALAGIHMKDRHNIIMAIIVISNNSLQEAFIFESQDHN